MAGEYDINLSNGNVLATLYPHEINGPDNRSTPRSISIVNPTFDIIQTGALTPNGVIKFGGDVTDYFQVGLTFSITGSTGNDGLYTVANLPVPGSTPSTNGSWYDSAQDETNVILTAVLTDPTPDGSAVISAVGIAGDMTYRFVSGFEFDIINSGSNDGTYNVDVFGSYVANGHTIIPVAGTLSQTLPVGAVQYSVSDTRTALKLPGKGVLNYGEFLVENMVRMLENFAAPQPPESNTVLGTDPTAQPLVGQLWYNTTPGEESLRIYNGTEWSANSDIDSGALVLRDPENINTDMYFTAAESSLPLPWGSPADAKPGAVLWTSANPPSGEPIFRVLSVDGTERLNVEHDGSVRTQNNLTVEGLGNSSVYGNLAIGGGSAPTQDRTLTVEGNGISVNATGTNNAALRLNSVTPNQSYVYFTTDGSITGEIVVRSTVAGTPLELNNSTTNDVLMVNGGGNVGIGEPVPSARLDVVGTTELNGTLQVTDTITFDSKLTATTAGYESLVVNPNDIPNKQFIDNLELASLANVSSNIPNDGDSLVFNSGSGLWEPQIPETENGVFIDELQDGVSGNGPTVFNTNNVATVAATSTTAYIQVFVNGVLQKEGAGAAYTVTGPNQITFNASVPVGADVTVYQL